MNLNSEGLNDYSHIDGLISSYPQLFTKNQIRWIVANKDRYEIDHAIKRIGRRLYFHVPSLLTWVDQQKA
jgi:hypothetical protein